MKKLDHYGVMPPEFSLLDLNKFDYFSNARLKKSLLSPWDFVDRYILGTKKEATPAMLLGKKTHAALLEPHDFKARAVVVPKFEGKGMRQAKKDFLADLPKDAIILSDEENTRMKLMLDSLLGHKKAVNLLSQGTSESLIMVRDEENELNHVLMPDFFSEDGLMIDVKSCQDASLEGFEKAFYNMGYYLQAGYYTHGMELHTGKSWDQFIFIMVESKPPFNVGIYFVDENDLYLAKELVKIGIKKYKEFEPEFEKAIALKTAYDSGVLARHEMIEKVREIFPSLNNGEITRGGLPYWAVNKLTQKYNLNMGEG